MDQPLKCLCLIDCPLLATGFAKVGNNIFPHWTKAGMAIDIWAIGFDGRGYEACPDWRLLPAGQWNAPARLNEFLRQLATGGYTHCFILQDPFQFTAEFCARFRAVCSKGNIRSLMYFPVDGPMDREWTEILTSVNVAVAYTEYGKAEAEQCARWNEERLQCHVLPHGVDPAIYAPRPEARANDRAMWKVLAQAAPGQKQRQIEAVFAQPNDFLLLNVNTNQRRKDPARSLELLAELIRRGVPAKLVMHCRGKTSYGVDLEAVGRQLGLQLWKDWIHAADLFGPGDTSYMGQAHNGRPLIGSLVAEVDVARFYNAADCLISTSLGEGWGLSLTEALACGCPVALPLHTSCREIYQKLAGLAAAEAEHPILGTPAHGVSSVPAYATRQLCPLPANDRIVLADEMSRLRWRVEMPAAADALHHYYASGYWRERRPLNDAMKQWLSWERIAGEMFKLLVGEASTEHRTSNIQHPTSNIQPQTLEVVV